MKNTLKTAVLLALLSALGLITACKQVAKDYKTVATKGEQGIQVVVEIPAGTNHKIEYNADSQTFSNDTLNGRDRVIDFLPYPGNYGFIPSTLMDADRGGDGDALDVLVLGESLPTGEVIEVLPVAGLLLRDQGELDTKIIAVPADSTLRTMQIETFEDLLIRYDAARRIIETWFLHYKGRGEMELIRWEDEQYALREIEKWQVK